VERIALEAAAELTIAPPVAVAHEDCTGFLEGPERGRR
jgi:hypothetical protein